ncbi:MAG: hypothetical protein HY543_10420 [Deltaproteobacteria bacterium]|nr:hypothetical protein [Deltaproteobacteria bacterium]
MPLVAHWIHLLAVVAWIGGLTYIVLVAAPVVRALDPFTRAQIAPRMIRRFLTLVWTSALLLLATGLYRLLAVLHFTTSAQWFDGGYGHTLMTKLFVYLLLAGIAGHMTFVTYPRVRVHMQEHLVAPTPTACTVCARLMQKARRMMLIAWTLGVIAILLAARLRGA